MKLNYLPLALCAICAAWLVTQTLKHTDEQTLITTSPVHAHPSNSPPVTESQLSVEVAPMSEIPFPVYPNSTRYRIGGEQGLKIALFETTDEFALVDAYYTRMASAAGLDRNMYMGDLVNYSQPHEEAVNEHFASLPQLPGILIHTFINPIDATLIGAGQNARTNIIISY